MFAFFSVFIFAARARLFFARRRAKSNAAICSCYVQTLSGRTLAVDISIWITQFIKAMRDDTGEVMMNAHLLGSFRRILKMLYHGIRPIFVFDGATPEIKMREVRERRQRRERGEVDVKRTAKLLILEALRTGGTAGSGSLKNGSGGNGAARNGKCEAEHEHGQQQEQHEETPSSKDQNVDVNMAGVFDDDSDSESSDDAILDVPYNPNHRGGNFGAFFDDSDEIDVQALQSLPMNERNDAIDKAKAAHRVQSRRTYMPVAGKDVLL